MSKFGDFYDEPTPEEMANANSEKLRRRVNEQFKLDLKDLCVSVPPCLIE